MKENKPLDKKQAQVFGFVKYKVVPCTGNSTGTVKNWYVIEVHREAGDLLHCIAGPDGLPEYHTNRKQADVLIEELIQRHKPDVEPDGCGEPVPRYYKDNQFLREILNQGRYQ
jgi:hypothetical protein